MAIETDMMVVPVAEEMYRDNSAALSGFCRSLMMWSGGDDYYSFTLVTRHVPSVLATSSVEV